MLWFLYFLLHFLFKLKRHNDYISAGYAEIVGFACTLKTSILGIILQCGSGLHGHVCSANRMTVFVLFLVWLTRITIIFIVLFSILLSWRNLISKHLLCLEENKSRPKRKTVCGKKLERYSDIEFWIPVKSRQIGFIKADKLRNDWAAWDAIQRDPMVVTWVSGLLLICVIALLKNQKDSIWPSKNGKQT